MSNKNRKSAAAIVAAAVENQVEVAPVVATDEAPKVIKSVSNKLKIAFLSPLISEGAFTAKELSEAAMKQFPTLTESTIRTFLTDSKNVKYNKFEKLVVVKEGKLSFAA